MIRGSIVALVTPMHPDGAIDWDAFAALLDWHIASGTDAVVAVGTTGESATLDVEEHTAVIRFVVDRVGGRLPVIAGTGANSTREAIQLSRAALELGADACLLVTPYYNKPSQEGLFQHFRTLAEQVAIPQILYNVPGRTACDLTNDTAFRLAGLENIIGIKDATGALARGRDLIARAPAGFSVWSGDDATAADLILEGAAGNISVTANVVPERMRALCVAALAGDREEAGRLQSALMPLHQAMFVESNPVPVKWALHRMGKMSAGIRLPLVPLAPALRPQVDQVLAKFGLLETFDEPLRRESRAPAARTL